MSLAVGTSAAAGSAPNAPTGLTATGAGAKQISLSWTAPSSGAAPLGYQVFEGTASGQEGTLLNPNVLIAGTTTTVNVASSTQQYYFVVVAVDAGGTSGISNEASATAPSVNPSTPTGLTATKGYQSATLSWTAISNWGDTPGTALTSEHYQVWASTTSGAEGYTGTEVDGTSTSATVTGLTNGTPEYFIVKAINSAGNLSNASNEVSATPGVSAPSAPAGLTGSPASSTSVTLSWTANTGDATGGDPIANYNVYQGTTSGGESSTPVQSPTTNSATITGLTAGDTYYFTVSGTSAAGTGPVSQEVSVTLVSASPAAPTALAATGSYASANLTWAAPTSTGNSPLAGYNVFVGAAGGGGPYTQANTSLVTGTSYTVTGLSATVPTTYDFYVEAVNTNSNSSGPSLIAAGTTALTSPSAPTGLYASNTSNTITLDWTDGAAGSSNTPTFVVNGATGNSGIVYSTPTAGHGQAVISGLTSGQTYGLSVTESTGVGTPATSSTVSIRTNDSAPDTPTGLVGATDPATAVGAGNASVDLTWNAPANQGQTAITSYNIYMNGTLEGNVTAAAAATSTPGVEGTTVTGLTVGTAYSFTVQAVNGATAPGNVSNQTASATVVPSSVPGTPGTPTVLAAGTTSLLVSWAAPSTATGSPATGYNVFESVNGGAYFGVASNVGTTSYTATGLNANELYTFEVQSLNANGTGGTSLPSTAASPGAVPPSAPTGLSATGSGGVTTLNWTAPSSNGGDPILYYEIFRSATVAVNPSAVPGDLITNANGAIEVPAGTTSATVVGNAVGTDYYYQVVAVNASPVNGGVSTGSNVANATQTSGAAPAAPNAPVAAAAGPGKVQLNWTAPTDNGSSPITGYVVTWYVNGAAVGSGNTTGTAALLQNLTAKQTYTFTVSAVNSVGASAQSSFSNAVTVLGTPASGPTTAQKNASDKKWTKASAQHAAGVNLSKLAKGKATVQSYAGLGGGKNSESVYVTVGKKKTLVATGSHTFSKIGHATLTLKATKAGKSLLKSITSSKKKTKVKVTGKVVSTPKGLSKQTQTATKTRTV